MLKDGRRTHALKNDNLPRPTPLIGALTAAICMMGVTDRRKPHRPSRRRTQSPTSSIIWGDDIGWFNVSAYNHGMMGYRTPNIDRIAKEGAMFTDWYGQQSCTAGRAAFITGQSPIRTGLTKVGLPGAPEGMKAEDPTIADAAQAARLRDRPVRQEPPRRPRRDPADRPRLRRVLRQPLPPERRGGAGEPRLSEGPRRSRRGSARAA